MADTRREGKGQVSKVTRHLANQICERSSGRSSFLYLPLTKIPADEATPNKNTIGRDVLLWLQYLKHCINGKTRVHVRSSSNNKNKEEGAEQCGYGMVKYTARTCKQR